ncbi:toxin-antitoxin system, toxin component [Streptomyces ipomoeae]|uniref:toxin-antitoxin system, toxin component n=1 Tax=Streptomyces ipomoeae TaxID=103232 RepID=UPI001146D701|nr:toxin-antitoxin system, toxin component [Streptomyces ipomoeae]
MLTGQTERKMKRLSAQLVTGLARTTPRDDDDGIFDPLCRVLGGLRGRPVVLKWTRFPPDTASGVWVELPEMDLLAIRDDTADVEHALVIWGHEVWHMMEGHCAAHTPVGSAAARSRSARGAAVEQVGALLAVPDARLGGVPGGDLKYATRTDFHAAQEAEAERFGLEFATEMRAYLRRPDLLQVTGRIEKSLGQGPWA